METRLASLPDAALLTALHSESFGEAGWSLAQITSALVLATNTVLIAEEAGMARGFILCQIAADEAEILTFCVTSLARRRGVGVFLLQAVLAVAQQKQVMRIFLEVAADNHAAITLYEKAGFRVIGKRPDYYRRGGASMDAVMLCKEIDQR